MKISHPRRNKKILWLVFLAIAALIVVFAFLLQQKTVNEEKSNTDISKESSKTTDNAGSISNSKDNGGETSSPSQTPGITPAAPTGTFVSNHKPNLSGSPLPNEMSSTCTTTPGVMCTISFTKDGSTLSLPAKLTGTDGSIGWNWTLQEIGLTAGNWQVKATATNGSLSSHTDDVVILEVRP